MASLEGVQNFKKKYVDENRKISNMSSLMYTYDFPLT